MNCNYRYDSNRWRDTWEMSMLCFNLSSKILWFIESKAALKSNITGKVTYREFISSRISFTFKKTVSVLCCFLYADWSGG